MFVIEDAVLPLGLFAWARSGSLSLYAWLALRSWRHGLALTSPSLQDDTNKFRDIQPTCVLDFFVHPSYQRCGFGRQLFEAMLLVRPHQLARASNQPLTRGAARGGIAGEACV